MPKPSNPDNSGGNPQHAAQNVSDASAVDSRDIRYPSEIEPPALDTQSYVVHAATRDLCLLHDMHAIGITEDVLLGDERITKDFCRKVIQYIANKNADTSLAIFFVTSAYVREAPIRVHGNTLEMSNVIEKLLECD